MFDCEIDFSEVERDWPEACRALGDGCRAGVEKGVAEGAAEARSVHRWKNITGALEQSIKGVIKRRTQGGTFGEIVATAEHASYLEEGTAAHEIRPKAGFEHKGPMRRGQSRRAENDIGTHRVALRFSVGGIMRFARVVHHPGTQASPFLGPGALKAERVILREVEIAEQKAAEIMAR